MSEDEGDLEDSEETEKENQTIHREDKLGETVHCQLSKGSKGERHVDVKLLDECPALSDYEKKLLEMSCIENKGPTEIGKIYNKDKSTIVSQRDRAYKKYVKWVETKTDADNVNRNKALKRLEVQDSNIAKIQLAIQVMGARRDRAKALLEVREKRQRVTEEALRFEAIQDPRKVPAYIKEVIYRSPLKVYRILTAKCNLVALRKGGTLRESWKVAAEDFGEPYDEWWADQKLDPERESVPTFEEYVRKVLLRWSFSDYRPNCRCSECGETMTIDAYCEDESYPLICFNEDCSNYCEYFSHSCPFCRKVNFEKNHMIYLHEKKVFFCNKCGLELKPKQELFDTLG